MVGLGYLYSPAVQHRLAAKPINNVQGEHPKKREKYEKNASKAHAPRTEGGVNDFFLR